MAVKRVFIIFCCFLSSFLLSTSAALSAEKKAVEKTMLFFVGEELEVFTLASKKSETPLNAPAVATVIDAGEIERRGVNTLEQLLETEPGFYMNHRASGTVPYLRGVQDGILFLYDGVPLTTNATRNVNVLDHEIPLSNVQRVEIIRGPGSVLWGADAFAGIVNVVPFKGSDIKEVETEIFAGTSRYAGASVKKGDKKKSSNTFLSAYYARDRYHKKKYKVESSIAGSSGDDLNTIDYSDYFELTGNSSIGKKIRVSGRLSYKNREYVMNDTGNLSWLGRKESPSGFIKAAYKDKFKGFDLTLSGYCQYIEHDVTNVDLERDQSDLIYSGELLLYRPVSDAGKFTFGSSFRRNHVDGAVTQENFLPISLKPGNSVFIPTADQADYTNNLLSAYGQYRHKWGNKIDSWLGIRYDDHSEYDNTLSYNLGINSPLNNDFRLKIVYGTAFRTPFPNQLIGYENLEPEEISTANLQLLWTKDSAGNLNLTLFHNRISNYVFEDPYGGLSFPSSLEIWGAELFGSMIINKKMDVYASLTGFDSRGDNIRYKVPSYTFVKPDGTKTTFYEEWTQPYDPGPEYMASLGFSWKFMPKKMLTANLNWTGKIPFSFEKNLDNGSFDITPTVSVGLKWLDFMGTRADMSLKADNLFDVENYTPGQYGPAEDQPLQVYMKLSLKF